MFYFFAFEFFRAFRNKLNLLPLCDATAEKHEISYSIYNPIKLKFAQKWNNFDQFYSLMNPSHCLPCPPINFGNSSFDTDVSRVFIGYKYSGISKLLSITLCWSKLGGSFRELLQFSSQTFSSHQIRECEVRGTQKTFGKTKKGFVFWIVEMMGLKFQSPLAIC